MNFMQQKIDELSNKIKESAQQYYTDGTSELSDDEFDKLTDELRSLDPNNPTVNEVGWGYDINEDNTPGEKYEHKYGLVGSLDKVRTWEEFKRGFGVPYDFIYASLKLDGLSVVLYYVDGKLTQALTRGSGNMGIDITNKVLTIDNKLSSISDNFTGAVRGEILMTFPAFKAYQLNNADAKNPRNVAAGLINRKDAAESDLHWLSIVVYNIVGDESVSDVWRMENMFAFLTKNFTNVVPWMYLEDVDNKLTFDYAMKWLKEKWYDKDYPADGIVLTNMLTQYDADTHQVKLHSVAFKFPSDIVETTVESVSWTMSKTRYAIPVVNVKPVELAGTTVKKCSGQNAQYIQSNNIGPGTVIKLTKANEIIPYIVEVVKPTSAQMMQVCPDCGRLLRWQGVNLICDNPTCANAQRQDLSVWLDHIAPVDGLQDAIRFRFFEMLFPDEDISIDTIMNHQDDKYLCSLGKTGFKKLISEMFDKLYGEDEIPLATAIQALNIPRFGKVTSTKLAEDPETIHQLVYVNDDSYFNKLRTTTEIGDADLTSLKSNYAKLKRLKWLEDRIDWNVKSIEQIPVCVTGKLSIGRSQFEQELNANGFKLTEMNKNVKYLITDDPESNSGKNQKATAWGIPKITESEFRNKFFK